MIITKISLSNDCDKILIPDSINPFKFLCPICGKKLKLKKIKKSRYPYRRGLRSYICELCGYAEYDSNEREQAITDGYFDKEL